MDWYKIAKENHDIGLYTAEQVRTFVERGKITEEEYKSIVEPEAENTELEG